MFLRKRKLGGVMTAKATHSTPMLHVAEIEKSIPFYERLGFAEGGSRWVGAIARESGSIMFLRLELPLDPSKQVFLTRTSAGQRHKGACD
jgi:hypothetical protein